MAAYRLYKDKKSSNWQIDFGKVNGKRTRESAGTEDKKQAEVFAKHRSTELWRQEKLGEQPSVTWDYAVIEWVRAHEHKKSIVDDKQRLRVLSTFFSRSALDSISAKDLRTVCDTQIGGISEATKNRYLAIGRSILGYGFQNGWTRSNPNTQKFTETTRRPRYLTAEEASRILAELPDYLRAMAAFSLATGLRESNVRLLEWSNVDLGRAIAWVHGDEAKAGKSLAVPLNASATGVLNGQHGQHWKWVFPLNGRPLYQCNCTAWKSALRRAGISNFRWHDLRHTWASWHVQNGTSLYDLKTLGGWASMAMVERYAHMTHERVAAVSGNIDHIMTAGMWQSRDEGAAPESSKNRAVTGRSWQARTADQRIKSPVAADSNVINKSSKIIDLRDKNESITRLKLIKINKSQPRETKVVAEKCRSVKVRS